MGMFNIFKNRKAQESAIPASNVENLQALEANIPKGQTANAPVGEMPTTPGAEGMQFNAGGMQWNVTQGEMGLGDILGMVGQAMKSGNAQVNVGQPQVIDMRGSGLREQMMEVMKQHGIDPENPAAHAGETTFDASKYQGMQEQMMQLLQQHGLDVSAMQQQAENFAQGQGIPQVSPPTPGTEPPQS